MAITAIIIYTYYESGRCKTAVEESLNDRMVIEPYEVRRRREERTQRGSNVEKDKIE